MQRRYSKRWYHQNILRYPRILGSGGTARLRIWSGCGLVGSWHCHVRNDDWTTAFLQPKHRHHVWQHSGGRCQVSSKRKHFWRVPRTSTRASSQRSCQEAWRRSFRCSGNQVTSILWQHWLAKSWTEEGKESSIRKKLATFFSIFGGLANFFSNHSRKKMGRTKIKFFTIFS